MLTLDATVMGRPEPAGLSAHPLLDVSRAWPESNCYLDLWIGVLHASGLDPVAMLGPTIAVDFEGEQWRFCKPSVHAIRELYGIEVLELQLYRELEYHVVMQARRGASVLVEVDAHWLPDTAGTTYRTGHQKTTIATWQVDPGRRRLRYVHNGGLFTLSGDDYAALFDPPTSTDALPPYAEFARFDRLLRLPPPALAASAMRLLTQELRHRTNGDAMDRFRLSLEESLSWLEAHDLEHYHRWAFATVRQLGAAAGLAHAHLEWLHASGYRVARAASAFSDVADAAKAVQFRLARVPNQGRRPDLTLLLRGLTHAWHAAMRALEEIGES